MLILRFSLSLLAPYLSLVVALYCRLAASFVLVEAYLKAYFAGTAKASTNTGTGTAKASTSAIFTTARYGSRLTSASTIW